MTAMQTLLWLAALLVVGLVYADEQPVLPALQDDARVMEVLDGLRENQSVYLGKARVVGEFNEIARRYQLHKTGPMGRNYSIKMVWAPDRKRALFAGANHAVPHRLNDVWEFDLAALAWMLLYPPDNPRSYAGLGDFSDVEFRDGVLMTRRGGPAVIGHTWWGLTYDTERRQMLHMNAWVTKQDEAVVQLGGDPAQRYRGPPLWAFTPQTGRWEMLKTSGPMPAVHFGGMLEYIPELKGALWHINNSKMRATFLYRSHTRSWSEFSARARQVDFRSQAPTREQVAYYDPVRRIVVAHLRKETFHLDLASARWTKVIGTGAATVTDVPDGYDARTPLYYDPHSGEGLLADFKSGTLWAYNPDAERWTRLSPEGDPMPSGARLLSYVDPARRVFVVIDGVKVWAYRYGRR